MVNEGYEKKERKRKGGEGSSKRDTTRSRQTDVMIAGKERKKEREKERKKERERERERKHGAVYRQRGDQRSLLNWG